MKHKSLSFLTALGILRSPRQFGPAGVTQWQPIETLCRMLACSVLMFMLFCLLPASAGERGGPFSYKVDDHAKPTQADMVSLEGGHPSAVVTVISPDGSRNEFVADEVVFHPKDQAELKAFVARYGGQVLRDGTPPVKGGPTGAKAYEFSGWYLIRVDLRRSPVNDLSANMRSLGAKGRFVFSSVAGTRLAALVAREHVQKLQVGPNFLMYGNDFIVEKQILEHPDGMGGYVDFAPFSWMTDVRDLANNRLGIGVVKAWDYLLYKGIPFGPKPWTQPIVAIVDGGFDLNLTTGAPLSGSLDYEMGKTPLQFNLVEKTNSAGGQNANTCTGGSPCPWHGQGVFGVAAAYPRNHFGAAGTGGDVVRPLLIRSRILAFDAGDAVRGAALHGASVINMSFSTRCPVIDAFCSFFFDAFAQLQQNIDFARGWNNGIVVAAAGNSNEPDNNQYDNVPCTLNGVICVGAISIGPGCSASSAAFAETFSGAGNKVAIWAPDGVLTTPYPTTIGAVGAAALPPFCGTSASAPFVSGIVGLMKALRPSLTRDDVVTIFQNTALKSPDPKVIPGYIDAFHAVLAASPNDPPTIQITSPKQGDNVVWGTQVTFYSSVNDPEQAPKVDGITVQWSSDKDGPLCNGIVCDAKKLSFGTHLITATVTDPYGASASDSITLNAISHPPSASIIAPPNGSVFFASQKINLRGFGSSPSETITKYSWSSNLSGLLSTDQNAWVQLMAGTHTITLTVSDSLGQTAQASITITVQSGADYPTAQILIPQDFADFDFNQVINLQGKGIDPVEGVLPDSNLEWFSSMDGSLGKGSNIQVKLSGGQCAPFYHKITLRVTNKSGKQGTHTITVLVGRIC
jgi:serine protease